MCLAIAIRVHAEHHQPARSLVGRLISPDGRMDAELYELAGKASDSFDYQIVIESQGKTREVAEIDGARRNDRSYGVDLDWLSKDELAVNYLSAENQQLFASGLTIDGHPVRVTLHRGVRDQDAPVGGMLFNLRQSREAPI
jgi:hypothetical protein